jgi:UDP-N-acetylglucosamine--N-acetylmuramyl-(pentapeptide) pyrophosphoryl-undecaprenol N-acetylglucosamine transferase
MSGGALILLTAGGTGGHVFPAEALADELRGAGHRLALVTDRRGTAYGGALGSLERYPISGGGIAGKRATLRLRAILLLARGYIQARRLIRRLRPAAVVGFGGYASVPAVLAASHEGIPTLVHEQNAVLGRANRLLAPRVSCIATSYATVARILPRWQGKVRYTGMPVRPAVTRMRDQPYPPQGVRDPLSLLVLGGSQGARIFSDIVPAALLALSQELRQRLSIAQQCRPEDIEAVRHTYGANGVAAELRSFFADAPARLAAAHLVISRSGASTMAELAVVGRPALLVPYLHAIDDHQSANARAFADGGGGWLLPQLGLTAEILADQLQALLTAPERLSEAAAAARRLGQPDAARRLAELVTGLIREGR